MRPEAAQHNAVRAVPRLHATWWQGALGVWCETGLRRIDSIAPAANPQAAASVAPAEVAQVLGARRLPHKFEVRAPVNGRWRRAKVPGFLLADASALTVLRAALHADAASWAGPDLRALAQIAAGVEKLVAQAQVVPVVVYEDGYVARWELIRNPEILSWLSTTARLLSFIDTDELYSFADWVCDHLVRQRLRQRPSMPSVVAALVEPEARFTGNHAMVSRSRDFAAAAAAANVAMVLRVVEPEDSLWRLQVLVRTGDDTLRPFAELPDPELAAPVVSRLLEVARTAYPPLADSDTAREGVDFLLSADALIDLVDRGVGVLAERGIEVLLPKAWAKVDTEVRITPAQPQVETEARLGVSQLNDINVDVLVGGVPVDEVELQRMVEASANLVQLRGQWVRADGEALRRAAAFLHRIHEGKRRTVAVGDGDGANGVGGAATVRAVLTEYVHALSSDDARSLHITGPSTLAWPIPRDIAVAEQLPGWFGAQLRDYQIDGVRWLAGMAESGLGAVLADDMGLGKTMQILALESLERHTGTETITERKPTLVIAPLSLVRNWAREAHKFAPELAVYVHHGPDRDVTASSADTLAAADLVITTYGTVVRDVELLNSTTYRRIVVDEAQTIKNANTQSARTIRELRAEHRVALTGTPVENRLEDLRAILDFCNPGMFGSAEVFRARFAAAIESEADQKTASRLTAMASPFVLRRTKNDPRVLTLPPKRELRVDAYLTTEQAALYQAVVKDMMEQVAQSGQQGRKGAILAGLTGLKQVCDHPALYAADGSALMRGGKHRSGKLAALDEILTAAGDAGEKVLIFTQYRTFGEMIVPYLSRRAGEPVPFLSGKTSPRARAEMVEAFQHDGGPPVFLASLRAGGTGLTLTAANHVVHLDRWWNPAVEDQATDRVHRIGQERDVHVHTLVSPGTVEERIAAVLEHKSDLSELTVGSLHVTQLSDEALWDLVSLRTDSHTAAAAYAASTQPPRAHNRRGGAQ